MKVVNESVISTLLSSTAFSKAQNGYIKLDNGLVIQWGYVAPHNDNEQTIVSFPQTYTTVYNVQTTLTGTENINAYWAPVYNLTNSGFKIDTHHGSSNKLGLFWFAIGI